jgi:hypothetical protein
MPLEDPKRTNEIFLLQDFRRYIVYWEAVRCNQSSCFKEYPLGIRWMGQKKKKNKDQRADLYGANGGMMEEFIKELT